MFQPIKFLTFIVTLFFVSEVTACEEKSFESMDYTTQRQALSSGPMLHGLSMEEFQKKIRKQKAALGKRHTNTKIIDEDEKTEDHQEKIDMEEKVSIEENMEEDTDIREELVKAAEAGIISFEGNEEGNERLGLLSRIWARICDIASYIRDLPSETVAELHAKLGRNYDSTFENNEGDIDRFTRASAFLISREGIDLKELINREELTTAVKNAIEKGGTPREFAEFVRDASTYISGGTGTEFMEYVKTLPASSTEFIVKMLQHKDYFNEFPNTEEGISAFKKAALECATLKGIDVSTVLSAKAFDDVVISLVDRGASPIEFGDHLASLFDTSWLRQQYESAQVDEGILPRYYFMNL